MCGVLLSRYPHTMFWGVLVWGMVKRNRCQVIAIISLFDGGRHLLVSTSRRLCVRAEPRGMGDIRRRAREKTLYRCEPGARHADENKKQLWAAAGGIPTEPTLGARIRP